MQSPCVPSRTEISTIRCASSMQSTRTPRALRSCSERAQGTPWQRVFSSALWSKGHRGSATCSIRKCPRRRQLRASRPGEWARRKAREKTLREFGDDVPQKQRLDAANASAGFRALFAENGYVLAQGKSVRPYTPSISIDGEVAQINVHTSDLVKTHMPDEIYGWAVASGAVHSEA